MQITVATSDDRVITVEVSNQVHLQDCCAAYRRDMSPVGRQNDQFVLSFQPC